MPKTLMRFCENSCMTPSRSQPLSINSDCCKIDSESDGEQLALLSEWLLLMRLTTSLASSSQSSRQCDMFYYFRETEILRFRMEFQVLCRLHRLPLHSRNLNILPTLPHGAQRLSSMSPQLVKLRNWALETNWQTGKLYSGPKLHRAPTRQVVRRMNGHTSNLHNHIHLRKGSTEQRKHQMHFQLGSRIFHSDSRQSSLAHEILRKVSRPNLAEIRTIHRHRFQSNTLLLNSHTLFQRCSFLSDHNRDSPESLEFYEYEVH